MSAPSGNAVVYPDFTVLNVRTRKTYLWEHFGRMDDAGYVENKMMRKIDLYRANGIYPGENLIMTFESANRPLQVEAVKDMINKYLK